MLVFVSEKTPESYLKYLGKRNYGHLIAGEDYVDYRKLLKILVKEYGAKTVLTDTGGTLNNVLLEQGLINEISLLISPVLVGKSNAKLFDSLKMDKIPLELVSAKKLEKGYVMLTSAVKKRSRKTKEL